MTTTKHNHTAVLLVDPQLDFFPGGSLAVASGDQIVAPINALLASHPEMPVFASRDWHPSSTKHFQARGGIWPPHCVQGTHGAQFHDQLRMQNARVYEKGTNPEDDGGYSAFDAATTVEGQTRRLVDDLKAAGITRLIVAGLATDYCIKATVLDALKEGFGVSLFVPGVRAVNLKPADGDEATKVMQAAGAVLLHDVK
jgi:nicotinamidase/pyrazinamidase